MLLSTVVLHIHILYTHNNFKVAKLSAPKLGNTSLQNESCSGDESVVCCVLKEAVVSRTSVSFVAEVVSCSLIASTGTIGLSPTYN